MVDDARGIGHVREEEKWVQGFGVKVWMIETVWKT